MKKILFVDEKKYRFSFYYKQESWWNENGVQPLFKAYERKIDKWLIFSSLLFNRPKAVVFVQLSLKNFILVKLCNLLNIKVLFWQHGVFNYNDKQIQKLRKFNASLHALLCFSAYDKEQIGRHFKSIKESKIIPHYETEKVAKAIKKPNSILYVGQILSKVQLDQSGAKFSHDMVSEMALDKFWNYLSTTDINVYMRKHPGDKSNYLDSLQEKYPNFILTEEFILPDLIAGHYSTLILPYLQYGVPFIQIDCSYNTFVNFKHYSDNEIHRFEEQDLTELIRTNIQEQGQEDGIKMKSISTFIVESL